MPRARITSSLFCKRGNTAGFTADGRAITGQFLRGAKAWRVGTSDFDAKLFPDPWDADRYAVSLMDFATTRTLAWWSINWESLYAQREGR